MNNHCPPFQDLKTLAANVCLGESTIERLVGTGQFPEPVRVGGKRLWDWSEVVKFIRRDKDAERNEITGENFHEEMQKLRRRAQIR